MKNPAKVRDIAIGSALVAIFIALCYGYIKPQYDAIKAAKQAGLDHFAQSMLSVSGTALQNLASRNTGNDLNTPLDNHALLTVRTACDGLKDAEERADSDMSKPYRDMLVAAVNDCAHIGKYLQAGDLNYAYVGAFGDKVSHMASAAYRMANAERLEKAHLQYEKDIANAPQAITAMSRWAAK